MNKWVYGGWREAEKEGGWGKRGSKTREMNNRSCE